MELIQETRGSEDHHKCFKKLPFPGGMMIDRSHAYRNAGGMLAIGVGGTDAVDVMSDILGVVSIGGVRLSFGRIIWLDYPKMLYPKKHFNLNCKRS
jgi:hypothetical protein